MRLKISRGDALPSGGGSVEMLVSPWVPHSKSICNFRPKPHLGSLENPQRKVLFPSASCGQAEKRSHAGLGTWAPGHTALGKPWQAFSRETASPPPAVLQSGRECSQPVEFIWPFFYLSHLLGPLGFFCFYEQDLSRRCQRTRLLATLAGGTL